MTNTAQTISVYLHATQNAPQKCQNIVPNVVQKPYAFLHKIICLLFLLNEMHKIPEFGCFSIKLQVKAIQRISFVLFVVLQTLFTFFNIA